MIESMYYYGKDTEGNVEGLCGQPEVQQHNRNHERNEGNVSVSGKEGGIHAARAYRLPSWNTGG